MARLQSALRPQVGRAHDTQSEDQVVDGKEPVARRAQAVDGPEVGGKAQGRDELERPASVADRLPGDVQNRTHPHGEQPGDQPQGERQIEQEHHDDGSQHKGDIAQAQHADGGAGDLPAPKVESNRGGGRGRSCPSSLRIIPPACASRTMPPATSRAGGHAMLPPLCYSHLAVLGLRWRGSRRPAVWPHRGAVSPQRPVAPEPRTPPRQRSHKPKPGGGLPP